jgi:predicted site-specific integrase-resolvase
MYKLLNGREAADILGVSNQTMFDWCKRGFVPGAQRVGRNWVIPEDSLKKIDRPKMGRPPKEENGREEG